ncbi:hypothetical protein GpSGHVEth080 [Glossina pallidipes salivary gland hypertrophy virus]|uniref:Uncharacterized protein n=1 Tax=Glossina hytrovirus (isolate Glossina pallidipes/Ethiopia/Seibersdorf/-) TaxID=379529 RepID=A0A109QQZ2_GHVS|nr:hypothetical protein GpSGHVEth080 [Glossina pallidipes salivary gland hypertrophy virus]
MDFKLPEIIKREFNFMHFIQTQSTKIMNTILSNNSYLLENDVDKINTILNYLYIRNYKAALMVDKSLTLEIINIALKNI